MAFQGSLDELPLPDIIQLVAVSGKTGVFDLSRESRTGQIFLRDGQIIHAQTSRLSGDEAVYELATWADGEFSFTQGVEASTQTIDKSNTNLLMEAARRMDEWKILSKKIPSTAHVPMFISASVNTSVSFSPQEWAIVCRVDGRRSIEDIAIDLGQSPFETCKNLYGLLTSGLLTLHEQVFRPLPERLRSADASQLERLMADFDRLARQGLPDDGANSLPGLLERARSDLLSGRGIDSLVDLVRAHEELIRVTKGDDAAHSYLAHVRQLAAGPPEGAANAQPPTAEYEVTAQNSD